MVSAFLWATNYTLSLEVLVLSLYNKFIFICLMDAFFHIGVFWILTSRLNDHGHLISFLVKCPWTLIRGVKVVF